MEEEEKTIALKAYSEPFQKGNFDISTFGTSSSSMNTTLLSSASHLTKPSPSPSTSLNLESDSETSSESPFQDHPSPSTEHLSKVKISTSDTPMKKAIPLNNYCTESDTSETPMIVPSISELTTHPIP